MEETTTSTQTSETAAEAAAKERIHQWIADFVSDKTGKKIGVTGAKKVFDHVITEIFTAAVKDGMFRFPAGFGSLHVRRLGVGTKPKRLPSGQTTVLGEGRVKLRYQEGVSVKQLLGTDKKAADKSTEATPPASASEAGSSASV